jgi:hypothetical protein
MATPTLPRRRITRTPSHSVDLWTASSGRAYNFAAAKQQKDSLKLH